MLKREITYEDFNGDTVTEVFYFNLSKQEIVEMQVEYQGGFAAMLERIVEEKDNRELVKRFKDIILLSYGVKSEDGKRFIKTEQLREEFSQTAAFQSLFMELLEKEDAAASFMTGVVPKGMAGLDQDKPAPPGNN